PASGPPEPVGSGGSATSSPRQLSPRSLQLGPGEGQVFSASGGVGAKTFSLAQNSSGGTISPASGLYQAGSVTNVVDTVRVSDAQGAWAEATVTVGGPASGTASGTSTASPTAGA